MRLQRGSTITKKIAGPFNGVTFGIYCCRCETSFMLCACVNYKILSPSE